MVNYQKSFVTFSLGAMRTKHFISAAALREERKLEIFGHASIGEAIGCLQSHIPFRDGNNSNGQLEMMDPILY